MKTSKRRVEGARSDRLRAIAQSVVLVCGLGSAACATEFKDAPVMDDSAVSGAGTTAGTAAGATAAGASAGVMSVAGSSAAGQSAAGTAPVAGASAGAAGTAPAGGTSASGTGGASAGTGEPTAGSAGMAAGSAGMEPEVQTCPATSMLQPGETTEMIQVGSVTRRYIQYVPASYDGSKPVPLILDWHPILTSSRFERGNSGYAEKAEQDGFIVVFPEGTDSAWNVGQCCTSSRSVDDLGFARAMIDSLKSRGCIDNKRIYSVGYSMGGGMSLHLACNAADVIAAVAPAAFELMEEDEWPCMPSRPIAVIQFNGTADFIVPYNGGASNPPNGLAVTNHFLGAVGTSEKLASLSGCTGEPVVAANGCNTYTQCGGGVEVALCTAQGGGHASGDPDVAWEFLKRFTLP